MSTKAYITSDFPTPREVASRLRIRPSRAAELRRRLVELHVAQPDGGVLVVSVKKSPEGKVTKVAATRAKKK